MTVILFIVLSESLASKLVFMHMLATNKSSMPLGMICNAEVYFNEGRDKGLSRIQILRLQKIGYCTYPLYISADAFFSRHAKESSVRDPGAGDCAVQTGLETTAGLAKF